MVRLHSLPLLLNVSVGLLGRVDAKSYKPRGLASESLDSQPLSLFIRDGLANGADPIELYQSIKVARAEAAAKGHTIDVPEEDLRAILDQIGKLHDEVDALLTGSQSKDGQRKDNGDAKSDAKVNGEVASKAAVTEDKTTQTKEESPSSTNDNVSDSEPSFDADGTLGSVSFKQKAPAAALDGQDSSKEDPTSGSVPETSPSNSPPTTSTSEPSSSSSAETQTEAPAINSTPVVEAAIASTDSENPEETITTTITSTTTRTITLTQASTKSTPAASETLAIPDVNLKAIDKPATPISQGLPTATANEASASMSESPNPEALVSTTPGAEVSSSTLVEPQIKAVVSSAAKPAEPSSSSAVEMPSVSTEVAMTSSKPPVEEAAKVAVSATSSTAEPDSTALPSDVTSAPVPESSDAATTVAESGLVDPVVKVVTSTMDSNSTMTGFRTVVRG